LIFATLDSAVALILELALPAVQPQKAIRFQVYASRIRKSFERQFVNTDGSLKSTSQTGHVLALRSAVLNPQQKAKVLTDLIALVAKNGSKVGPYRSSFSSRCPFVNGKSRSRT
jgi:hypothetical protein